MASAAIDGNTNTKFSAGSCTHTYYSLKPWLAIDLGAKQNMTGVLIYNRADYSSR